MKASTPRAQAPKPSPSEDQLRRIKAIVKIAKKERKLSPHEVHTSDFKDLRNMSVAGRPLLSQFLPYLKQPDFDEELEILVPVTRRMGGRLAPAIWTIAVTRPDQNWSVLLARPDGGKLTPEKVVTTEHTGRLTVSGRAAMMSVDVGSLLGVYCGNNGPQGYHCAAVFEIGSVEVLPGDRHGLLKLRRVARMTDLGKGEVTLTTSPDIRFQLNATRNRLVQLGQTLRQNANFATTLYDQYANIIRPIASSKVADFVFRWTDEEVLPASALQVSILRAAHLARRSFIETSDGYKGPDLWRHQVPFAVKRTVENGKVVLLLSFAEQTPKKIVVEEDQKDFLSKSCPWVNQLLREVSDEKDAILYYCIRR